MSNDSDRELSKATTQRPTEDGGGNAVDEIDYGSDLDHFDENELAQFEAKAKAAGERATAAQDGARDTVDEIDYGSDLDHFDENELAQFEAKAKAAGERATAASKLELDFDKFDPGYRRAASLAQQSNLKPANDDQVLENSLPASGIQPPDQQYQSARLAPPSPTILNKTFGPATELAQERQAMIYLEAVIRHGTHLQVDTTNKRSAALHSNAVGKTSKQNDLEAEIDRILSAKIPAHPIYNKHRIDTLYEIIKLGVAAPPNVRMDEIEAHLAKIDAARPKFGKLDRDSIADLYRPLKEYKKIKGGDPTEFPPLEVLGYRRQDRQLTNDPGFLASRVFSKKKQLDNLKEINRILDGIVPGVPYYDKRRQAIVETTLSVGEGFAQWVADQKEPHFTRNPNHYRNIAAMETLERDFASSKKEFDQVTKSYTRLAPSDVISIGMRIHEHQEISALFRDDTALENGSQSKRRRLSPKMLEPRVLPSRQLPSGIEDAVRREPTQSLVVKPQAANLARQIANALDATIPPERGNFKQRMDFLKSISSHRYDPEYDFEKWSVLKNNEPGILIWKNALEDYHMAWAGKLPQRHAAPSTVAASSERVPMLGARRAPPAPRGAKDRAKAAIAPGQTKLGFSAIGGTRLSEKGGIELERNQLQDPPMRAKLQPRCDEPSGGKQIKLDSEAVSRRIEVIQNDTATSRIAIDSRSDLKPSPPDPRDMDRGSRQHSSISR